MQSTFGGARLQRAYIVSSRLTAYVKLTSIKQKRRDCFVHKLKRKLSPEAKHRIHHDYNIYCYKTLTGQTVSFINCLKNFCVNILDSRQQVLLPRVTNRKSLTQ